MTTTHTILLIDEVLEQDMLTLETACLELRNLYVLIRMWLE